MPSFTVHLRPAGAVVQAKITPHGKERELVIRGVLDISLVQLLDLKPVGTTLAYSLTTGPKPVIVNVYHLSVEICPPEADKPSYRCEILTVSTDLFRLHVDSNQAMFGQGVLENCLLTYNGVLGTFTFAY